MKYTSVIKSIAYSLPKKLVSNEEAVFSRLNTHMKYPPKYWGIDCRYHIDSAHGETDFGQAMNAAKQALEAASINAQQLDLLLVSATSPIVTGAETGSERLFPRLARDMQIGLQADGALAFDIEHECGSFMLGLQMAANYIKAGRFRNVLVCASEHISRVLDFTSPSSVIFGDCATAAVVCAGDGEADFISSAYFSDSTFYEIATMQWRQPENCLDTDAPYRPYFTLPDDSPGHMQSFVPFAIPKVVNKLLSQVGIPKQDIACFIFHQPSSMIVNAWAHYITGIEGRYLTNMQDHGCMVASSLPFTLHQAIKQNRLRTGDYVVIAGAAVGWSFGAQLWRMGDCVAV